MLLLTSFVTIRKTFEIRRSSGRLEHPNVYHIVFFAVFCGFTDPSGIITQNKLT